MNVDVEHLSGLLDSIENRCAIMRILIAQRVETPGLYATLIEDNFSDIQELCDHHCVKEEPEA